MMTGQAREGVIKFRLDFEEAPAPTGSLLRELNAWRRVFVKLGLIGRDPERYGGYGFGNLSRRLPGQADGAFLISGTQTGHLKLLRPEDYATVHACDPAGNLLRAAGRVKPSSEAMSHGILYQSSPAIHWVMHLHSPDIFDRKSTLQLPCTNPNAGYGTPEMAAEILRLTRNHDATKPALLVMGGHQDGILAFGPSAHETGGLVIMTLAAAWQAD